MKQRSGTQSNYRVPNMTTRAGDFSDLVNTAGKMTVLYDPLTTGPGPDFLRQPFNYGGKLNNIDPARISPFMKYVYSILPEPNIPASSGGMINGYLGNNYYGNAPQIQDEYTWGARFDHRFSDNDLVYGRITKAMRTVSRPAADGVPTPGRLRELPQRHHAQREPVARLDPHLLPHVLQRVHVQRQPLRGNPVSRATSPATTRTNWDFPTPTTSPATRWSTTSGWAPAAATTSRRSTGTMQFFNYFIMENNGTKIAGKHEIQYGMHLRHDQLTYMPQQQRTAGNLSFAAVTTGLYDR